MNSISDKTIFQEQKGNKDISRQRNLKIYHWQMYPSKIAKKFFQMINEGML